MIFTIQSFLAEKINSGCVQAMTVISSYFEKWKEHIFTICLNGRNHGRHWGAVQHKLYMV